MNDNEGPKTWKIVLAGLAAVLVLVGVPIAIWGFRVGTAPIKGDGDTIIMNQDAKNRVAAQGKLRDMYYGIIALDQNIDQFAATAKAHPTDRIAQANLDGQIMACRQAVQAYNSESGKVLVQDWHDPETPNRIDGSDTKTDCRENEK